MNAPVLRVSPRFARLVPVAASVVVLLVGVSGFIWPATHAVVAAGQEATRLEQHVEQLRRQVGDASDVPVDTRQIVAEFERLVPADDRTSETMETLARLALDPPDDTRARNLSIETGQADDQHTEATSGAAQSSGGGQQAAQDPRWALFPYALTGTPMTLTFETTYDRVGVFLWRLRELPALVEIRSLEITRALPLLKVKVVLVTLRRTNRPPARPAKVEPLASLAYNIFALARRSTSAPPPQPTDVPLLSAVQPPTSSGPRRVEPPAAPAVDPATIPAPPAVELSSNPVWSRDPFLAVGERRTPTVQVAAVKESPVGPDPVVASILYSKDRQVALVDHKIVRAGDPLAGGVVTEIQRDAILIGMPSGRIRRVELGRVGGGLLASPRTK